MSLLKILVVSFGTASAKTGQSAKGRKTLRVSAYRYPYILCIRERQFFPRRQTMPLDLKAGFFQLNSRAEIDLMPRDHSADLILVVQ